ncbi:MAG: hypothetical protein V3W50_00120 [Thermoanaerobaculia bacterium]
MKTIQLTLALTMLASLVGAVEIPSEDFSAVAEKLVEAYNEVDPEAVKALLDESAFFRILEENDITVEEWPTVWSEHTRYYHDQVGKIESHHLEELDPPDGAFLTLHHEHGASELFVVLNEEGQATELNMRPVGQHSCSSAAAN